MDSVLQATLNTLEGLRDTPGTFFTSIPDVLSKLDEEAGITISHTENMHETFMNQVIYNYNGNMLN